VILYCAHCKEPIEKLFTGGALVWHLEFREGCVYHKSFRVTHKVPYCLELGTQPNENTVIRWISLTDLFINGEVDFSYFFNAEYDEFGYLIDDGREFEGQSMEDAYYLLCGGLDNLHIEPPKLEPIIKSQKLERGRVGYVYLIHSVTGHYKIGRTSDPQNRMKTFTVKLPFEVEYVCIIACEDMHQLEWDLHQKYHDKRVNGEWFQLDPDDVEYIKGLAV
jgi:hypothetical protein